MAKDALTAIPALAKPLLGPARVPGDKSISHRAVLFSAMADGTSRISGVLNSADVRSSLEAVSALGAQVDVSLQEDGSYEGSITGWGAQGPKQPDGPVYCGNSGTTVRLLMGVLAPWDIEVELTGDESLSRRPMLRITEPLSLLGASFYPEGKATLPITVKGTRALKGVSFESPVASAQLKSALLLAGTFAEGKTEVFEPAASRNHTELMLPEFGVRVDHRECYASVCGPNVLRAAEIQVPGDPSSAAFLACAAVMSPGSDIEIAGVGLACARIGFVRVLERMGARVRLDLRSGEGKEPSGSIFASYTSDLRACEVEPFEIASMVDEIPVLSLLAAHAQGTTVFRGVGELRVKETDRLAAIIEGLAVLGIHAWEEGDDLYVEGKPGFEVPDGLVFDSKGDHRLAMTWSLIALTGTAEVKIRDFDCVAISYPQFLDDMRKLAQ